MNKSLDIILNFRMKILSDIEGISIEQLNTIPEQHSNNIIWNIAHMNAVMQVLCYKTSYLQATIADLFITPYMPGTRPGTVDANDAELIRQQFLSSVKQLGEDLDNGIFTRYRKPERIEKIYHISIENIEDAIRYVAHHEGIHYHAVLSILKKLNP